MAKDASNDIVYYIQLEASRKDDLASIRSWSNLKVAFDSDFIWIKDFDFTQINSLEVKSISFKTCYYSKQGKLFFIDSLLPERNVPALLWTQIDRAISVKLPSYNHNYFGLNENIETKLVLSNDEHDSEAMITDITALKQYIISAPEIRLKNLKWTILNNTRALIVGLPMLPIKGEVYWKNKNMLLPAGYDFEFSILIDLINKKVNPENDNLVIWNTDSTYALIDKTDILPLSLSSFKRSIKTTLSASDTLQ